MTQNYNIITSAGSRNSASGYGKIYLVRMDEKEIINIASQQAGKCGYGLTQYAGIEWVVSNPDADFEQEEMLLELSRDWIEGEEFEAALAEFAHDGHLYEIFKCGEQDEEFIARAADFDLEEEATAFVE